MNRNKILEKFSNRFKTNKKMRLSEFESRKTKREGIRAARRQRMNEEEEVWESHRQR